LGGAIGIVGAIAWRFIDQRIATPEEARAATGAECLGIIPSLPAPPRGKLKRNVEEDSGEGQFIAKPPILAYAVEHPLSQTWCTLRNVKAACQDCFGGKGLRYLGVTSTVAGEGRSTVAANLALALAAAKRRVLLVDSDVYNPSLTRQFAGENHPGLVNYIHSENSLRSYVLREHRTGLDFLSLGTGEDVIGGNIWTDSLRRFFEETLSSYDYVIFDMPPLHMLGDMRDSARYLDGFLMVIGWQQASMESIQFGMQAASSVRDRLLGSVLNKVNIKEARWTLSPGTAFSRRQKDVARSSWRPADKASAPRKAAIAR
jgi:succinoglycan biosynthesis transport protein ExoP